MLSVKGASREALACQREERGQSAHSSTAPIGERGAHVARVLVQLPVQCLARFIDSYEPSGENGEASVACRAHTSRDVCLEPATLIRGALGLRALPAASPCATVSDLAFYCTLRVFVTGISVPSRRQRHEDLVVL